MYWTIPDKGTGIADRQSILFQAYLDQLTRAFSGYAYIASIGGSGEAAGSVTQGGSAGAVSVASGSRFIVAGQKVTSSGSAFFDISGHIDTVYPRFVVISVDGSGNVVATAGTAEAECKPSFPAGAYVHLAVIYLPPAAVAYNITSTHIVDMRIIKPEAPQPRGDSIHGWDRGYNAFYENPTNIALSYTITSGKNAMSAGPITIDTGVTVTVPTGSTWTIV